MAKSFNQRAREFFRGILSKNNEHLRIGFWDRLSFFAHSFYSPLNTDACSMMTKLLGRMGVEPLQVGGGSCAAGGGGAAGGQVEAAQVGSQLEGDGGGGRGESY